MFKVPWAEPMERALTPYQGFVTSALVAVVLVSVWVMIRGNSISRTAWLVWLISP